MKVITKFQQRSVEWHEYRWGMIGSTAVKKLMVNKDIDKTVVFFELLHELQEDFDADNIEEIYDKNVVRGNELEPFAIQALEEYLFDNELIDKIFEEVGLVESTDYKRLGLSPDRLTRNHKQAAEVKCPTGRKHIEWMYDGGVPYEHVWQAVHYFTVMTELEVLWWASYRPENKKKPLFVVMLTIDSKVNIGTLVKPVMITIEGAVSLFTAKYELLMKKVDEELK